jgi:hypothetical protein
MKRFIYICAMAEPKGKIKKKMKARSDKLVEHIAKCAMYGDTLGESKYNHWIEHEIANWISEINELVSKPDNKKLKPKFYENILFGGLGDDLSHAKANLTDLQIYNSRKSNPYPEVKIDSAMINRMYVISQQMFGKIVPILSTKNNFSKKDIEQILHNILDPVCKGI